MCALIIPPLFMYFALDTYDLMLITTVHVAEITYDFQYIYCIVSNLSCQFMYARARVLYQQKEGYHII